jgi:hypothetical protein
MAGGSGMGGSGAEAPKQAPPPPGWRVRVSVALQPAAFEVLEGNQKTTVAKG